MDVCIRVGAPRNHRGEGVAKWLSRRAGVFVLLSRCRSTPARQSERCVLHTRETADGANAASLL